MVVIQENNWQSWSESLSSFKYSLFLTPEWILAVQDDKSKSIFLDFYIDNHLVGKLSGLLLDSGGIKGRQFYCYAGPAVKNANQVEYDSFHVALLAYAKKEKWSRIILGSYDQQTPLKCELKEYFTTSRFEYKVDVSPNSKDLSYNTGFKKNIRRGERIGTAFKFSNSEFVFDQLLTLIGVTKEVRVNKYGTNYNPFYLQNLNVDSIIRVIKNGIVMFYCAENEDGIHSVQLNIEKDGKAYGLLMGSDPFAYKNGLPAFIDHNIINTYKEGEFEYYNTGGGTSEEGGSGLEKYKMAMGGERFDVFGATTNFLNYPLKALNPILNIGRNLPKDSRVYKVLKKII